MNKHELQPKKIAITFNPHSGMSGHETAVQAGVKQLRSEGFDIDEQPLPQNPKKIESFLERVTSGEYDVVIAAGGDGSVNALAERLVGTEIQLFVVPAGTFNHFAKHIGMPQDISEAFHVFKNSELEYMDTGEVNGHVFVNFSSVGVYTEIIRERTQREKIGKGKWPSFFFSFIRNIVRYHTLDVSVERSGAKVSIKTPFIFVGNNPFVFGGTDVLSERESFEEGVLHFLIAKNRGRFGLFRLFFILLFRTPHRSEYFDAIYLRSFEMRSKKKYLNVTLDGEITRLETPLVYETKPRSLGVLVPRTRGKDEE